MKELISFSLKRRFLNGATILLNILLCIVCCGIFFSDKVIEVVFPSLLEDQKIYLNLDDVLEETIMGLEMSGAELIRDDRDYKEIIQESPNAYVLYYDDGYKIASHYAIDAKVMATFQVMMKEVHETLVLSSTLTMEEFEILNQDLDMKNIVLQENVTMDEGKKNVLTLLITSIYFATLTLSTSVANEVVYEKSTRQLELILTSVSAKTHYMSKMAIGWFGILIQAGSILVYGLLAGILRILYDEGKGLIKFINKIELMKIDEETILDFLGNIQIDAEFIIKIVFIMIFLLLGILILQMLMVIISSFITSAEEAGNIQNPLYLILMGIYYFSISVNTPYQMSEGIGYILSFFPFLSMLFMPCRLLIQNVSILELCLSAFISFATMYIIVTKGVYIYQKGVLDYTNKGFIDVMKKTLEGMKYETLQKRHS